MQLSDNPLYSIHLPDWVSCAVHTALNLYGVPLVIRILLPPLGTRRCGDVGSAVDVDATPPQRGVPSVPAIPQCLATPTNLIGVTQLS